MLPLIPVLLLAFEPADPPRVKRLIEVAATQVAPASEAEWSRLRAIRELGTLGSQAEAAARVLMRIAEDPREDWDARSEALAALEKINLPTAMTVLVRIAGHPGGSAVGDLSEVAIQRLIALGEPAIPAIIDVFRRSDVTMESTEYDQERVARLVDVAARALADIGQPALPSLIEALGEQNERVRVVAAAACGAMGPAAAGAIPALTAALWDASDNVPWMAAAALGKIGPDSVTPQLVACFGDRDERVRRAAAQVVRELGPRASATVPAVVESLRTSRGEYTQQDLVEALGSFGPAAAEACSVLSDMVLVLRPEGSAPQVDVARQQLLRSVDKALEQIECQRHR
jgi:HEAT repeat protein